ncbi:MAG: CPBP family intramembrane glutamic endopeptidase [Candidatus Eiseniibacteriota bacterium]
MNPIDVVLILAFAVVWPAYGARTAGPALKRAVAAGLEGARVKGYWDMILEQWTFSALALASVITAGRTLEELRLLPPSGVGLAVSVVAIVLVAVFFAWQSRQAFGSAAGLEALRRQLEPLEWFMPHGRRERTSFRAVSVTAGVCEEWFFRGYMLAILTPLLGLVWAVVASTLVFGLAHAYQGPTGIVRTGLVGLLMAGLAVFTGSLWAPIVVHALVDWIQGDMVARVLEEQAPVAPAASEPIALQA